MKPTGKQLEQRTKRFAEIRDAIKVLEVQELTEAALDVFNSYNTTVVIGVRTPSKPSMERLEKSLRELGVLTP